MNIRNNLDDGKCLHYQERMRSLIEAFKVQLSKHIQASELFRNMSEVHVQVQTCGPLRQRLYAAKESEDVAVLQCISSTTLPQFRRLSSRKSVAARCEVDGSASNDGAPAASVPQGRRSSQVKRRSTVESVSQQIVDPLTASNLSPDARTNNDQEQHDLNVQTANIPSPRPKASCRTSEGADIVSDGVELQEVVVERYGHSQAKADSLSRAAAVSLSSKADTSKRLSTAQGLAESRDAKEATHDARRKSATRLSEVSRTAASAAASAVSATATGRHISPQPHHMLGPGAQNRTVEHVAGRAKPGGASSVEGSDPCVQLPLTVGRERHKPSLAADGTEAAEPESNSGDGTSMMLVAHAQHSGQIVSSTQGQTRPVLQRKKEKQLLKTRPSVSRATKARFDLSDFPPPPPYEYDWA
jgi:hypothetical protein